MRAPGEGRYYRGVRSAPGVTLVTVHDPEAGFTAPLTQFVRHSPRGYEWGDGGPGAADLARALLIDALGPAALCEGCNGTRLMVIDPNWNGDPTREPSRPYHAARDCHLPPGRVVDCICGDGLRTLPYHDFKYAVVAHWGKDDWEISRAAILEELTTFYPPGAVPAWLHDVVTEAAAR